MEFEKILRLIESVSNSELTSFTLEENGTKLILEAKRGVCEQDNFADSNRQDFDNEVSNSRRVVVKTKNAGNIVKSPLVGTFYCAPSPGAEAYVKVGDSVSKGQTLGIVEAMKLMNEIESDFDGIVKEVLIENGAVVEFGQPLFVIG